MLDEGEVLLEAVFEELLTAEEAQRVIQAVYADLVARGELGDQGQASHR